jgi:hypothetical protein
LSRIPVFSTLALILLLGCGGGAADSVLSVSPERTVLVGDQLALSAFSTVDLAGEPEWEVQETFGGGLRNSVGGSTVYFAPEAAGTYHLTLRAALMDGRKAKQTVAIQVLPIMTLEPASAQVAPGGSVGFTLTSKGLARNPVKWTVEEEGGGEIDQDGRYQAPARAGTYHVTASAGDPQVSARATVAVGG